MRTLFASLVCASALLVSMPILATPKNQDVGPVVTQQQSIRADVLAGKQPYKTMPSAKRDELLAKQAELLKLLEGKKTFAELTEAQQIDAFNTLEWMEAAINNAEEERMVCKREKPTGSNRTTTVCKTVAQIREEQEAARNAVDRTALCDSCNGK